MITPRRRKNSIVMVMYAILSIGCNDIAMTQDSTGVEQGIQPVLRTEGVVLSAEARVKKLEGKVSRLKRIDQKEGYQELFVGDVVRDGDILVLDKKSALVLEVPEAAETSLWAADKSRWFTINVEPKR